MAGTRIHSALRLRLGLVWLHFCIFQGVCILMTNGQILGRIQYQNQMAHQHETQLRQTLLQGYNSDVIPLRNTSSPLTLRCGFTLVSIREMDPLKQILTMEGWMKMIWVDSRLTWNPENYMGIKKIHVPPAKLWIPDLTLYNRAKSSEVKDFNDASTVVFSDGKVLWVPAVTLYIVCPIDLKYYPYDEHTCSLTFGSWTRDAYIMDIQLFDQADILEYYFKGGEWEVSKIASNHGLKYYKCCTEPYPHIIYYFTLRRLSPLYKCIIMCPVIAAVLLVVAAFWMAPWRTERILLNGISLSIFIFTLAQLSFKLPSAGPHVPLIVVFCGSFLLLLTIITISNFVFLGLKRSSSNTAVPSAVKFLLQSWMAKLMCIGHGSSGSIGPSETKQLELTSEKKLSVEKLDQEENKEAWLQFYQLLDRAIYITLVVVVAFVLIAIAV